MRSGRDLRPGLDEAGNPAEVGEETVLPRPDGKVGPWQRVEANTFALIRPDAERPASWIPGEDLTG
jgi:hypothetical protein